MVSKSLSKDRNLKWDHECRKMLMYIWCVIAKYTTNIYYNKSNNINTKYKKPWYTHLIWNKKWCFTKSTFLHLYIGCLFWDGGGNQITCRKQPIFSKATDKLSYHISPMLESNLGETERLLITTSLTASVSWTDPPV